MRRILTTTASCNLLASSFSMNRRNPLLITFLTFMAMSIMKKTVWRHLTPYSCDQIVEVGAFQARHRLPWRASGGRPRFCETRLRQASVGRVRSARPKPFPLRLRYKRRCL
jgi:hypothetical protein